MSRDQTLDPSGRPDKADAAATSDALAFFVHSGDAQSEAHALDRKGSNPPVHYTFKIFRDWRGMYRWMLTDQSGRRLSASPFGFAAIAGAFRDAEVERDTGPYGGAGVRDETGR